MKWVLFLIISAPPGPTTLAPRSSRLANDDLWDVVLRGEIRSLIDKVFPLEDAAAALVRMNGNEHFGKIVWVPGN